MRLQHPIFQGPLTVDVTLEPSDDPKYPGDTWLVHTGTFDSSGNGVDVGMVSNGFGFEDSPDCERISGGINSKGPHAVAIGREANLLSWGFYGAPDRMTPSARAAFLNTIVYMRQFDGCKPLVASVAPSREMMKWYIDYARDLGDMPEERRDSLADYIKKKFPADVIAKVGLDPEALTAWYESNAEYLHVDEGASDHTIDVDLAAAGVSNRKLEFFPHLIALMREDPKDGVVLRLSALYLPEGAPRTADDLARWYAANESKLFFSDVGGFRWFVDTRPAAAVEAAARD